MDNKFKHVISLGCSCGVAMMLEQCGMRNIAYPFDWIISPWNGVEKSIENGFIDWFDIDLLYQSTDLAHAYKNRKYGIKFFHDFNGYDPLHKQTEQVEQKYERRIKRFYQNIQEPCLFIRKIFWDECVEELNYLYENYDSVLSRLKSYNENNEICFIVQEKDFRDEFRSGNFGNRVFLLNESDLDDCSKAVGLIGNKSIVEYLQESVDMDNYISNMSFLRKKKQKEKFFL